MTKKNSKPAAKGSKAPSNLKNDSLPTFDEKALLALTAKIEKGFEKDKPQLSTPNASSNGSQKQSKLSNGVKKSIANPEPKKGSPALTRGIKRDANGNAKGGSKVAANSQGPPADQKNGKGKDERAVLLQEILALGGTEEDLDLIADAESDEEDKGQKMEALPDKSLKKELAKFVADLGIEGNMAEEESEPEVDGDKDGDKDGWEEASDVESSVASDDPEETEPAVKVPAPPSKDISSTKDANRLVSTVSLPATLSN
jgi:ribosome biogenesis protein MAK21